MPSLLPKGARSVMASRVEPLDSLDDFVTPPWATRALVEHVIRPHVAAHHYAWEPACNRGLMAAVLEEYFAQVSASDIHDYGAGYAVADFLLSPAPHPPSDWTVTNPPFRLALDFALRAIETTAHGVALLTRTSWLEGGDRYERLFKPHPPAIVAQFSERVPMVKGRWDPDASTATSYAWVVWLNREHAPTTRFMWIPPGQRKALTRLSDLRFARTAETPLLDLPRAHSPELAGGAS